MATWLFEQEDDERSSEEIARDLFKDIIYNLKGVQLVKDAKNSDFECVIGILRKAAVQVCIDGYLLRLYMFDPEKPDSNLAVFCTNEDTEIADLMDISLYDYDSEEVIKEFHSAMNVEDFRDLLSLAYDIFLKRVLGKDTEERDD